MSLASTRVFGHGRTVSVGLRRRPLKDLYHWLVAGSWLRTIAVFAIVYFATRAVFDLGAVLLGAEPAPPGALAAALVAAARGEATPAGAEWRALAASALGAVEGFVRWLEVVVAAGIVLTKFSNTPARVMWSRCAVIGPHAGGRALLFRMANERSGHIVDARAHAMLVVNEIGPDGALVRRAKDLPLQHGGSALFSHAWTAVHAIDAASPLAAEDAASLEEREAEIVVTLSGHDEALGKTLHARHVWPAARIRWNVRFRELLEVRPGGTRVIDYRKFHEVEAAPLAAAEAGATAASVERRRRA
jgi:inward rectifier potassium channel